MTVVLDRARVDQEARVMFPFCPSLDRRAIVRHVVSHPWPDGTDAASALRFSARAHVRHRLLGYGQMMAETGMARSEARRAIGPTISKIVASWEPA